MKRSTFKTGPRKFIHEVGAKGERDRDICSLDYERLCRYFRVKRMSDAELAKLTNAQFYLVCDDIFKRQSPKRQRKYAEKIYGRDHVEYRIHPLAFHWYYNDMMRFGGGPTVLRFLSSPFRYIRFLNRKYKQAQAARIEEEANENADK